MRGGLPHDGPSARGDRIGATVKALDWLRLGAEIAKIAWDEFRAPRRSSRRVPIAIPHVPTVHELNEEARAAEHLERLERTP